MGKCENEYQGHCPSCGKTEMMAFFTFEYDYVQCCVCKFSVEQKDWNKIEEMLRIKDAFKQASTKPKGGR